jgi:hypothetical protein
MERKILINFNKKIYPLRAVKLAIKEYRNLANFSLRQKGNYIIVELKDIDKDVVEIIKDEFCNYVLFKSKQS